MLYKYNPSQISPQELEATFVGRECLIEEILSKLNQQAQAKSNQNYLVIGPRGIGKTNTIFFIVVILIVIVVSVFFAKTISDPVRKLKEAADKATSGEFDAKLPEVKSTDEVAEMTGSIEMLITAFKRKLKKK